MVFSILLFFLGLYIFYFSSFHSLLVLLFIETFVLSVLYLLLTFSFSWFFCLLYLLIAVCLGAYGVSLLVSLSRSKGMNYFFSF